MHNIASTFFILLINSDLLNGLFLLFNIKLYFDFKIFIPFIGILLVISIVGRSFTCQLLLLILFIIDDE